MKIWNCYKRFELSEQNLLHLALSSCLLLLTATPPTAVVPIATRLFMNTHGGTQVLEEGHSVLPTEILKLDLLEMRVEIHPFALRVVTLLCPVEILHQDCRDDFRVIRDLVALDVIGCDLHEGWNRGGPLLDETYHQWVLSEAQLLQVCELD